MVVIWPSVLVLLYIFSIWEWFLSYISGLEIKHYQQQCLYFFQNIVYEDSYTCIRSNQFAELFCCHWGTSKTKIKLSLQLTKMLSYQDHKRSVVWADKFLYSIPNWRSYFLWRNICYAYKLSEIRFPEVF